MPSRRHEILHSHAAIHDRSQFEVKLTYDVSAEHVSAGRRAERFRIEAFFFFQNSMGLTPLNFPKESFYKSLHAYIRFKTPELPRLEILDPLSRQSPLNAMSFALKRLAQGADTLAEASHEARLFGCVVSHWLSEARREITLALTAAGQTEGGDWPAVEALVSDLVATCRELLDKYRAQLRDAEALIKKADPAVSARLRQVDEYLTYRVDDTLTAIHLQLGTATGPAERRNRLARRVRELAERESAYRRERGFIMLAPGDEAGLALYTYRSGALKKLMEQVLYLDVKTIQQTHRWRNLAAMLGALLAAVVAGYGDRRFVFPMAQVNLWLAVAVFAAIYVIKDRIKEVLREYVWERVAHWFPDNKRLIHDPIKDLDVGRCTERVRYMPKKRAPADVLGVRNSNHTIDLDSERDEQVIVYQNDVRLNARSILAEHRRRTHVKHILRFSVDDLLGRLDNPTAKVRFFDPQSEAFYQVRAPKVYHLNVVLRFTRWDDQGKKGAPHFQRVRVILDKNGILRVEPVEVTRPTPVELVPRRAPAQEKSASGQ